MAEKTIDVRLDPRVALSDRALEFQTRYSLAMYDAYHAAQDMVESIDLALADSLISGSRRATLTALRGSGAVGNPDIVYGSIYAVSPVDETLVGFQEKALFLMNVLQGADARPTTQAMDAAAALEETLAALVARWEMLR